MEIFDLRREDVIGRTIWEVSPTAVGTEFERRYRLVMTTREKQVFETFSTRRPDRYHEIRAFPLGDGIGVAFRDVTDTRRWSRRCVAANSSSSGCRGSAGSGACGSTCATISWPADRLNICRSTACRPRRRSSRTTPGPSASTPRTGPPRSSVCSPPSPAPAANTSRNTASFDRATGPCAGSGRSAEIERDADGKATALVGAHIDITERKLAEQEAVASEGRLRAIADALPVLISYVDSDQVFRFVNRTYEIWFERPRSEILGRRVDEVMNPEMYEARRSNLERALAGEEISYEVEFPRSGGLAFTEVTHVPHRDASGRVLGVYVVVTDVTQRKLSERAIAESEARFRAIANSAPVPMWVTGADGRREFVNQAYLDFFGGSYDEALAFDWRKALHPDDLPRILREEPRVDPSLKSVAVEGAFPARRRAVAVAAGGIAAALEPHRRACRLHRRRP